VSNITSPNEFQYNVKKKFGQILSEVTKKYFAGAYECSLNVFDELPKLLSPTSNFTEAQSEQLKKMLRIFYLGQLVGLPTLHSIFQRFEITSNKEQINYSKLCKQLSNNIIHQVFEYIFEDTVSKILKERCTKHHSNWSRELVTIVLDDSVFKQWLQQQDSTEKFQCCYGRFFSGQFGQVVYGFQVVTLGVSIDGVLYPLYFACVKKKATSEVVHTSISVKKQKQGRKKQGKSVKKRHKVVKKKVKAVKVVVKPVEVTIPPLLVANNETKPIAKILTKAEKKAEKIAEIARKEAVRQEKKAASVSKKLQRAVLRQEKQVARIAKKAAKVAKTEKSTIQVAIQLVEKLGLFLKKLANQGYELPTLHFSCDSGYSHASLANTCSENGLIYISVPKKNHIFQINGVNTKLNDWIANVFIPAEKLYYKQQLALYPDKKHEKGHFNMRITGFYESQNIAVTLLAFRLNGSNTVSVIYTPNKTIMAKTLRRHWFQRTYIEQFFKLLKHVMCIQQAITPTKHLFEFKLLRFAFVALHLQKLLRAARKKYPDLIHKGIGYFKIILQSDKDILDSLQAQF
jgi:hypothetical protein